jgi:hypothetical protein
MDIEETTKESGAKGLLFKDKKEGCPAFVKIAWTCNHS